MGVINENLHVEGALTSTSMSPTNAIAADKVKHRFTVPYKQDDGADVASKTALLFTAYRNGQVVGVEVVVSTPPAGGDKQFTVDVQKGNQAGAFATILSAVVTINTTVAAREVKVATISTATYNDGDTLRVVITASGSTGTQGQGVVVNVICDQDPS